MATFQYEVGASGVIGLTPLDDYSVQFTKQPVDAPSSTTYGVRLDAITETKTFSASWFNYPFEADSPFDQPDPVVEVLSGPATISNSTVVSTGIGDAVVRTTAAYGVREYTLTMANSGSFTQTSFAGSYVAGSLSADIQNNIRAYIDGRAPSNSIVQRYSSVTPAITAAAFQAAKNPNLMTGNLDLSWLSARRIYPDDPQRWDGGDVFPSAVISKRHILCARHVGASPRTIFQKTDGTFIQVNLISGADLIVGDVGTDCKIYYVDADLSGVIAPVLFAPTTGAHAIQNKLPLLPQWSGLSRYSVPALASMHNPSPPQSPPTFARGQKMLIVGVVGLSIWGEPFPADLASYYFLPYGGDSSSMVFFPVTQGGVVKPVLVSSMFSAGSGPAYADPSTQTAMIALMRRLAADQGDAFAYDLTYADLSAFNSY